MALAKSVLLVGEQTVGIGQLPSKARLSVRGTIASEQYAFFVRAQPQLTIFPPLETPISPGLAPSAAQASVPKAGPGGKIPATQKQYVIDFNDPHDQINPQGVYDARRKAFIAPLAGIYYLSTTIQVSESANLGESFTLSLITSGDGDLTIPLPRDVETTSAAFTLSRLISLKKAERVQVILNKESTKPVIVQVMGFFQGYLCSR
ncbi:MAG TPA: hypothetical protein P5121_29765 [Caldilineaceae bacterium]|nr:hypothetical protein [Caldilineaceae bacterium]